MKKKQQQPIGIFDSGLGGLTVVKEVTKLLPKEKLIYVGDTARVPYGTKSAETIRQYAKEISGFLLRKKVKAIVVACNSASAAALPQLKKLKVPVLGVIKPGARAAVHSTRVNRVGVIGTNATMESHAYKKAIHQIIKKCRVWEKACPLFVPLVETGWLNGKTTEAIAREYLRPLLKNKIDTLVLGCTHYPLLKKMLRHVTGKKIKLIDSAEETAKDLKALLQKKDLMNTNGRKNNVTFYVTDHPVSFSKSAQHFLGSKNRRAQRLSLDRL